MTSHTTRRCTMLPRLAAIGVALLAGLAVTSPTQAQGGGRGDPQQRMEQRISRMTEKVQLTDAQVPKVREILNKEREAVMALRDKVQNSGDRQAMRTEMQSIREKNEKAIDALLTDAQRPAFKAFLEEERQARENGPRRGPPGGR